MKEVSRYYRLAAETGERDASGARGPRDTGDGNDADDCDGDDVRQADIDHVDDLRFKSKRPFEAVYLLLILAPLLAYRPLLALTRQYTPYTCFPEALRGDKA